MEAWHVGGETNAQGAVEFAAPAGAVEITASHEKRRGTVRLDVPQGGTAEGEIRLAPAEGAP